MRKVLSIVLVLALVLGSVSMAFAAPMSDVKGGKYEDAVNVLTELGVVNGYPDGTYKPANIVTRGEMAKIVICALGLEDYAAGSSSFKDMGGHWADKYVAYAVSLGIINGYPDGTFKPDNTVTYDEAAKMLVAALGYTEEALVGSWPVNWVTKARVLGILDGVKAGSAGANRGDIALMAFQTLDIQMGKVNKDGDFVTTLDQSKISDTMLDRLGAKLYDPGAANAYEAGLAAADLPGASFVVRGNESSIISLKELQGALVTAYANADGEIIAIKEVLSTFITEDFEDVVTVGQINATDKFGDYKIKSGFDQAGSAAGRTKVFANGAATQTAGTDNLVGAASMVADGDTYTIAAKISGNYIEKIYSIASWDATVGSSVEKQVDEDDLEEIADGEFQSMDFPTDNKDEVDYTEFALFGVTSLDEIEEDDIVTAYDDGAGVISRLEVGKEVVTGVISKITSDGKKITVDGKVYKESANAATGFAGLNAGDEVELFLNYEGKVHELDVIEGDKDLLAIVVDYDVKKPATPKDTAEVVVLFLTDGTTKTFEMNKDLSDLGITGRFDNTGSMNGKGGGGVATDITRGRVVEYSLDKNGKLSDISIVAPTKVMNDPTADISKSGTYDGKYIASDAIIFTSSAYTTNTNIAGGDEDDWGVTTFEKVKGLDDVDGYFHYDSTSKKIDWMVISGGDTEDVVIGVYNGYAKVNTDAGYEVYMMVDGADAEYEADAVPSGYAGTVVAGEADIALWELKFASDGTISSKKEIKSGVGDYDHTAGLSVASGNKVKNSVLTISGTDYALDAKITVYTFDGDEWAKGSTSAFSDTAKYDHIVLYKTDKTMPYDIALVAKKVAPALVGTDIPAKTTVVDANGTFTVEFSEAINGASQTAVEAVITAAFVATGSPTALAYSWSGATLTITVAGTTAGTDEWTVGAIATVNITDLAWNTTILAAEDLQL